VNIAIGYIQANGDEDSLALQQRQLLSVGCDTVRIEQSQPADLALKPVLGLVCEFLGDGDELVVPDLTHLGPTPGSIISIVTRLEARGASLRVRDPDVSTLDRAGRILIDALSQLEAAPAPKPEKAPRGRRPTVDAVAIRALSARGLGPTQIARRLGVSRMTVWRKLAEEPSSAP
jgi:DNA invertase Pin-like site-specific DNA recombinase